MRRFYQTFAGPSKLDLGLDEAPRRGWLVVSMKHDWARIFPWQKP